MKKLFCMLLVLGLLAIGSQVFAEGIDPSSGRYQIKTFVWVKSNDLTEDGGVGGFIHSKYVPTATIDTNDKILGFTVTATEAGKGAIASFHDLASAVASNAAAEKAMTNSTLFVEAEVGTDNDSVTIWFPYPKILTTQLAIMAGQAQTVVTVYYLDV